MSGIIKLFSASGIQGGARAAYDAGMDVPQLTPADVTVLLQTVQRFAARNLAQETAQPHHPMLPEVTRALVGQLVQLGVLNLDAEPACGLWDGPDDPLQRGLSLQTLRQLAACSPGLAYQVHQQALAALLAREAGVAPGDDTVVLEGWLGLGQQGLLACLGDQPLSPGQVDVLADCWSVPTPEKPRWVHALADWQFAWVPVWTAQQGWRWHRLARAELAVQETPHSHGFDELSGQRLSLRFSGVTAGAGAGVGLVEAAAARQQFITLSALYGMGLLAIAAGAARRALTMATDYAGVRRQGGRLIRAHAAVAQLLGEARQTLGLTDAALAQLEAMPLGLDALVQVWRTRAMLHPLLCTAASHAMQVLGGVGYMRDQGVEKMLRDCNQLRLLGGSPMELTLCSALWEPAP